MPELEPNNQTDPKKAFSMIRNRVIGGFFVVLPIAVTLWLSYFLYTELTEWSFAFVDFVPISIETKTQLMDSILFTSALRLASVVFILAALFLVGQLTRHAIGQRIITMAENLMLKIPMLNIIYSTTRQIWKALWSPDGGMFRQVVLFEYPRKDIWVIGFVTNENKQPGWELNERTEKQLVSVFLPTTPNPTSGFLLFIPKEDCTYLDMSVAEGMRLVISGGAVASTSPLPPAPGNMVKEESE